MEWKEQGFDGFSLNTFNPPDANDPTVAGDWFIIDYTATQIGDCHVWFYSNFEPVHYLAFSHVSTRDFNNDAKVDFADFSVITSYWQVANCQEGNLCEGADLDSDGAVDVTDLIMFADYWLESTE